MELLYSNVFIKQGQQFIIADIMKEFPRRNIKEVVCGAGAW